MQIWPTFVAHGASESGNALLVCFLLLGTAAAVGRVEQHLLGGKWKARRHWAAQTLPLCRALPTTTARAGGPEGALMPVHSVGCGCGSPPGLSWVSPFPVLQPERGGFSCGSLACAMTLLNRHSLSEAWGVNKDWVRKQNRETHDSEVLKVYMAQHGEIKAGCG